MDTLTVEAPRRPQPGEDRIHPLHPDTAARTLGYLARAGRPADLADPRDVELLYNNALTMAHCGMVELLDAAKSLGIDTADMACLIARWAALAEADLPPGVTRRQPVPAAPNGSDPR